MTVTFARVQVRDRLPHLKAIVQYKGKLSQEYDKVYDVSAAAVSEEMDKRITHWCFVLQWEQFLELGKDVEDGAIEEKIAAQRPEQCALLIYTVGVDAVIDNIDLYRLP